MNNELIDYDTSLKVKDAKDFPNNLCEKFILSMREVGIFKVEAF